MNRKRGRPLFPVKLFLLIIAIKMTIITQFDLKKYWRKIIMDRRFSIVEAKSKNGIAA